MELIDLFCGGGTFSAGFVAAGGRAVAGVDNDEHALAVYRANFANAVVCCRRLPLDFGQLKQRLPPLGAQTHIHLSPPCTAISSARRQPTNDQREDGLHLLAWSIELVLHARLGSWSIEDVDVRESRAVAEHYRSLHPDRVEFVTLDASSFGAPQRRTRLYIVPPDMKDALVQEANEGASTTIRQAFEREATPLPSNHVRATAYTSSSSRCVRTVEEKAFTVVASRAGSFCDATGERLVQTFSPQQSRILMGLPREFVLPANAKRAQRILGNGVAGQVAAAIYRAAAAARGFRPEGPHRSAYDDTQADDLVEAARRVAKSVIDSHSVPVRKRPLDT
jgi:site-specific DNA-cytosine methylase